MKTWIVALLIMLSPGLVNAATRSEMLKQVEYSMLVKGIIETDAAGNVSSAAIEKPGKFPAGLVEYVQQQVAAWKFEPVLVNGQPRRARSKMSLLVVAKKLDKQGISIRIRNASFDVEGLPGAPQGEMLAPAKMAPPFYPGSVAAAGVAGTAYVVVKVGKDGNVQDAVVEQVNLLAMGKEKVMASWRSAFADAALKAARQWTFKPPGQGPQVSAEFWSARVPVAFRMDGTDVDRYGKWQVYIPGSRQSIPWWSEDTPSASPDSLADGGVYMLGQDTGPKLLTALDGA